MPRYAKRTKRTYSLRDFGQLLARSTKTLQRWDREGTLTAKRTPTGRRYYTHEDYLAVTGQRAHQRVNVAYCRVSASGQKSDLANQKDAVEQFCIAAGREIRVKMEDLGSGLNYRRRNFCRLMEMVERGEVAELVIAHKDRLALSTIHCFASRLCGLRKHMRKAATLVRGGEPGAAGPQDPAGTDT